MPFGIPSEDFHGGFGLPHDEDNVIDVRTKEQKRLDAKAMKFNDLEFDEGEVIQALRDAGIEIYTPEDAEYNNYPTIKELADQWCENRLRALDDLYDVAVELDARERTSNCVVRSLLPLSWDEVCDKGIEALQKLKEPWKETKQ